MRRWISKDSSSRRWCTVKTYPGHPSESNPPPRVLLRDASRNLCTKTSDRELLDSCGSRRFVKVQEIPCRFVGGNTHPYRRPVAKRFNGGGTSGQAVPQFSANHLAVLENPLLMTIKTQMNLAMPVEAFPVGDRRKLEARIGIRVARPCHRHALGAKTQHQHRSHHCRQAASEHRLHPFINASIRLLLGRKVRVALASFSLSVEVLKKAPDHSGNRPGTSALRNSSQGRQRTPFWSSRSFPR